MKKIYISLFIAAFSINLFCQADSLIVLDSTYSYTWDKTADDWAVNGRILNLYNTNGNKTEETE
ncbi:MAG: hypothetical protein ABFS38_13570, partial [Bacteroidota bacterium]